MREEAGKRHDLTPKGDKAGDRRDGESDVPGVTLAPAARFTRNRSPKRK